LKFGPEIALVFFYFLVIVLIIQRMPFFKIKTLPKNFLISIFTIKVVAGIALAFIYTKYYPNRNEADIFKYFDDSKYLHDAFWTEPKDFFKMMFGFGNDTEYFTTEYYSKMNNWFRVYESNIYNDSHTIIRFNALLRFFSFGVYHVHTVIMCFLSLIGLVAFYKAVYSEFKNKERILAFILFLVPSLLFWSSGVLKEGLLIFGIGVLIYCCFEFFKGNFKWYYFPLMAIVLFLLLFLKIYALMLLIPCLFSYWLIQKLNYKFIVLVYFSSFTIATLLAVNFHFVKKDYNMLEIITYKQHDFIKHAEFLRSGSVVKIDPIEPNLTSFILHAPESLFITFFRPFFFESTNPLMIISGLENLFLFLLLIFVLIYRDKLNNSQKNLLYFLLFFSITMYILVGLVTPVMGAMVRYKVPALMTLVTAFVLIGNWKNLLNNYPKLKKRLKIGV